MADTGSSKKFALSIKGGGIRGIITAYVLAALEQQTGKLCRDIFSYVAGTSTGSLLAGAIAAGIEASKMVDFYTNSTAKVFTPGWSVLSDAEMVARGHKYDIANLMKLLKEVFAGHPVSWTLNDCPIGIMIATTAMNGHDWYLVRDRVKNAKTTGTVNFLEAMCASAAAPTYFDAQRVSIPAITGISGLWMVDGGTGSCANPSYKCANEMFVYDDFYPASTRIITLGTGYYPVSGTVDSPPVKGLLEGIEFATNTLVSTSEDLVDQAASALWPYVISKYDWKLPSNISMDDLSAIPTLAAIGKSAAASMNWKEILWT